jgi:hypothetical protein
MEENFRAHRKRNFSAPGLQNNIFPQSFTVKNAKKQALCQRRHGREKKNFYENRLPKNAR